MTIPNKSLIVLLLVVGLVVCGVILSLIFCWIDEGTFVVISLTLLGLIFYTYFTYQLVVKKEEPTLTSTIKYVPQYRDIRVHINNPTIRYLKTQVFIKATVYGKNIDIGPAYSGQTVWHMTPYFSVDGHFQFENLLKQVGKTFDKTVEKASDENRTN